MQTIPVHSLVHNTKAKGNSVLCTEARFAAALRLFVLHRDNTSLPPLGIAQTYCLRKARQGNSALLCQTFSSTKPTKSCCLICTEVESLINFLHKPSWESEHTKKCMHWNNSMYIFILNCRLHLQSSEGSSCTLFITIIITKAQNTARAQTRCFCSKFCCNFATMGRIHGERAEAVLGRETTGSARCP